MITEVNKIHDLVYIFSYKDENNIEETKKQFPEEEVYDEPNIVFLPLHKIPNIRCFEEQIKFVINNSSDCLTYDTINGNSIREFFHCDNFYQTIFPKIEEEFVNHNT